MELEKNKLKEEKKREIPLGLQRPKILKFRSNTIALPTVSFSIFLELTNACTIVLSLREVN